MRRTKPTAAAMTTMKTSSWMIPPIMMRKTTMISRWPMSTMTTSRRTVRTGTRRTARVTTTSTSPRTMRSMMAKATATVRLLAAKVPKRRLPRTLRAQTPKPGVRSGNWTATTVKSQTVCILLFQKQTKNTHPLLL
uniref:(northern house mosquito) hypothetical protein n=1 Tax=Culex pipiens TaxID=7175 RepID=A0A8D8H845_CULPI